MTLLFKVMIDVFTLCRHFSEWTVKIEGWRENVRGKWFGVEPERHVAQRAWDVVYLRVRCSLSAHLLAVYSLAHHSVGVDFDQHPSQRRKFSLTKDYSGPFVFNCYINTVYLGHVHLPAHGPWCSLDVHDLSRKGKHADSLGSDWLWRAVHCV